jgi:pyruvyltransferase
MATIIKAVLRKIRYGISPALYWAQSNDPNWGDDFNPWLFEKLTGKKPVYCPHKTMARLLMAGSILEQAGPLDFCWGSGLLRGDSQRRLHLRAALAVRGPLTASILADQGIECLAVYGDPGLLAADFVNQAKEKKCAIAVIPHYSDAAEGSAFARQIGGGVVPVSLPNEEFVRQISSAEKVLSSSLHGLICAESMGIPAYWIRFSDQLIGGNFKFHDYLAGTGRITKGVVPIDVTSEVSPEKLTLKYPSWEPFDLDGIKQRLLDAFPAARYGKLRLSGKQDPTNPPFSGENRPLQPVG